MVRDPRIPSSISDLDSGEPTCPAPPPLAGTDDSSNLGYTLPVRIKLTNGIMLAGYSPAVAHYGQGLPFYTTLRGLTGWVNARVQLPSMKFMIDPADVTFCEGAGVSVATPATTSHPDWGGWDCEFDCGSWSVATRPDGSQFHPIPSTFSDFFLYDPSREPSGQLNAEDLVVNEVGARLKDVRADGALDLEIDLALGLTLQQGDGSATHQFPVDLAGTFTTVAKAPITPDASGVPWDIGEPPPRRPSYLPARPLRGAVEGESATVGSNTFSFDTRRLDALQDPEQRWMAANLATFIFGMDKYGTTLIGDQPWFDAYSRYFDDVTYGRQSFLPMAPGLAESSIDQTIDKIGLRQGVPAGCGFDQ